MIGEADVPKLTDPWLNLSSNFGVPLVSPSADVEVRDGDAYEAAGFEWQVRAIPGHSVGHVVYLWEGQEPAVVFVGRRDFRRQQLAGPTSPTATIAI